MQPLRRPLSSWDSPELPLPQTTPVGPLEGLTATLDWILMFTFLFFATLSVVLTLVMFDMVHGGDS